MYKPTWESLETHPLPAWYDGAKLGIFIHWGLYSVPAWAPLTGEFGKIDPSVHFLKNPYAEWYQNTMRIEGSPTNLYHKEKYGEDFQYEDFAEMWKAEKWDPNEWAKIFKDSGAKYVVLTSMHHDGFSLWPSKYNKEYSVYSTGPKRDLVGELTDEVRKSDMKMGLYYSGFFNWTFTKKPIQSFDEQKHNYPQTYTFADYAYNQVMELIDEYAPDILWSDIGWPEKGLEDVKHLFAYYYNLHPEGVVNDRWHVGKNNHCFEEKIENFKTWYDFSTEEYSSLEHPAKHKWEATRGLGYSFGYNQAEGEDVTLSLQSLIHLLIDVVSKNGNLLINVGPRADGSIPEIQKERLIGLGNWLKINGEAIYDTKPWNVASTTSPNSVTAHFTSKDDCVYLIVLGPFTNLKDNFYFETHSKIKNISPLGNSESFSWEVSDKSISLDVKNNTEQIAQVFKIQLEEK